MPASAACMLWKRANYTESEYLSLARSQPAQNRKSQTSQSQITTTVAVSFQNRNSESQTESQNGSPPHQFVPCHLQNRNSKYINSPKMVSTPSLVFFGLFHITFPRYHQQPSLHPSTLLNTRLNHGLVNRIHHRFRHALRDMRDMRAPSTSALAILQTQNPSVFWPW